jgi:transcriptional regulator with XRE-family HTH domain
VTDDRGDAYRMACGQRLQAAREAAGLTRRQVAYALGITNSTVIGSYEEDGVLPQPERMFVLADVLGVSPGDIWGTFEL